MGLMRRTKLEVALKGLFKQRLTLKLVSMKLCLYVLVETVLLYMLMVTCRVIMMDHNVCSSYF